MHKNLHYIDNPIVISKFFDAFIDENRCFGTLKSFENVSVYLFDFFGNYREVSYENVLNGLKLKPTSVFYVMSNLSFVYQQNKEIPQICRVFKMEKDELLSLLYEQKKDMRNDAIFYYNEEREELWDLIIFDTTYQWALSVTHEENEDGCRLCLEAVHI